MSVFDWKSFLSSRHIPFVSVGKNVKSGHINIKCPFCGAADPSEHMGLELATGYWGCWRNAEHRGKAAAWIIARLLRISLKDAKKIAGETVEVDTSEGYYGLLKRCETMFDTKAYLAELAAPIRLAETITPDSSFKPFFENETEEPFLDYLVDDRKFDRKDLYSIINQYQLRYATTGHWKWRIIIPIIDQGNWVGWTGRTIGQARERYLTHPQGDSIKKLLFNGDVAYEGGDVLVGVEGPLDTINFDRVSKFEDVRAVGFLGTGIIEEQILAFIKASKKFKRSVILMDENAFHIALSLRAKLSSVGVDVALLPEKYEDPGELPTDLSLALARCFREGRNYLQ